MKKIKSLIGLSIAAISAYPAITMSSCSKTQFYAVPKSSLYVGETFKESDVTVILNDKQLSYDSQGQNGFKIESDKYSIGYEFKESDIGQHTIKVVYKDSSIDVTITVTMPKVITPKFPVSTYTQRSFKTPKVASKIYTVNVPDEEPYKSYKNQWYVLLESLEGILAQTEARLFVYHDASDRNTWLAEAKKECGFETEEISPVDALTKFKDEVNDQGLVLYSADGTSINQATTIAGVEKYLMCDNGESFLNTIKGLGFNVKIDAVSMTTKECFNTYKDKVSHTMMVNQKPSEIWLRDYAVASKSFTTYLDYESGDPDFRDEVLNSVVDNAPVYGWTEDEVGTVDLLAKHSKVIIPSNHCGNLSLYSGYKMKQNSYQVHKDRIIPEQGKHYIALVMSDGDNIQWLQNDWSEADWFGNANRGSFPMNWTISPTLLDANPQILDRINTQRTYNDYFVCSGSGYGYTNLSVHPKHDDFAMSTAEYMKNCDMSVGYYLDPYEKKTSNYTELFRQSQLIGGVWALGDRYAAGKGGVYWINNKPLVCCRETLWEQEEKSREEDCFSPENMAKRINGYTTNPYEISGYSVVNCHCWSYGKMDEVATMIKGLDSHVQVVTLEQLITMIAENVPHTDVDEANDYPSYYK